jgi:hypothetical protein
MTFNIRKTNDDLLVSIPDGTRDTARSSLILFGRNFASWGTAINENFVHLMEHFADQTPPQNPLKGQLWYDTINKEMKVYEDGVWNLLNANSLQNIAESVVPNRLYVSKSGSDGNSGRSWFSAKRTIKSACLEAERLLTIGQAEPDHVTILVSSGDYTEVNPVVVPAGVSIIGDNLRSVTVRPATVEQDVFHLESGTYIYGVTVRDHKLRPSALDITPIEVKYNANASGIDLPINTSQTGFAFAFKPGTLIRVSPYIQNCSSISGDPGTGSGIYPGGGGVLVDGDSLDPASRIFSIVVDAFTQINLGGIGVKVVGKGYMQLVSFFVNFCQFGMLCVDGGHVTALNSNCSFGNYALWSEGFRYLDNSPQDGLPGAINQTWPSTDPAKPVTQIPDGSRTQFTTAPNYKATSDQILDLVVDVTLSNGNIDTSYVISSVTNGPMDNSVITLDKAPPLGSVLRVRTRFGSLIEASGYTMSYAGAGLSYARLSDSQGGVGRADSNKYTISRNFGRVYHTTTDESGDFYVGEVTPGDIDPITNTQRPGRPSFRINQRRGSIDGRAFYQSIFGFMAPFVLALTRRSK